MLKRLWPEALFLAVIVAFVAAGAFLPNGRTATPEAPQAAAAPIPQELPPLAKAEEFVSIAQAARLPVGGGLPARAEPVNLDAVADLTVRVGDLEGKMVVLGQKLDKLIALQTTAVTPPPVAGPPPVVVTAPAAGGCGQAATAGACGPAGGDSSVASGRIFDGQGWRPGKIIGGLRGRLRGAGGCN